jgi:hypothetical protein
VVKLDEYKQHIAMKNKKAATQRKKIFLILITDLVIELLDKMAANAAGLAKAGY